MVCKVKSSIVQNPRPLRRGYRVVFFSFSPIPLWLSLLFLLPHTDTDTHTPTQTVTVAKLLFAHRWIRKYLPLNECDYSRSNRPYNNHQGAPPPPHPFFLAFSFFPRIASVFFFVLLLWPLSPRSERAHIYTPSPIRNFKFFVWCILFSGLSV